jgi:hypothetical protein
MPIDFTLRLRVQKDSSNCCSFQHLSQSMVEFPQEK